MINPNTTDFASDFLKSHTKKCDFEKFHAYWEQLQKVDQLNLLRMLFNGKSDLLRSRKDAFNALDPNTRLTLEKVTIGGKASGWVSKYLDEFFQSVVEIEGTFSEKGFRRYLENEDNRKNLLRSFQNNFLELYSLIERLCGMIDE